MQRPDFPLTTFFTVVKIKLFGVNRIRQIVETGNLRAVEVNLWYF